MTLREKLFAIQSQNLKFPKDAENPFFKSKYLSLDSMWEKLQPALEEHKLLVVHQTINKEVVTTVMDTEGDGMMSSAMPLPENLDPQKIGSAVTYFKRYNLGQLFNIITDDDDDGNATKLASKEKQDKPQDDELESIIG